MPAFIYTKLTRSTAANTVMVWDAVTFEPLYVIHAPQTNIGDIFSLAYHEPFGVLFLGSQDASISSVCLPKKSVSKKPREQSPTRPSGHSTPLQIPSTYHRFFDSRSRKELVASLEHLSRTSSRESPPSSPPSVHHAVLEEALNEGSAPSLLQIDPKKVISYAHYGYIYTLALAERDGGQILISGSGDGTIKLWRVNGAGLRKSASSNGTSEAQADALEYLATLYGDDDAAIFSVIYKDNTILAALQGGKIKVFDFETRQCIRRLDAHKVSTAFTSGSILTVKTD
jgi:di- and tripeptidase